MFHGKGGARIAKWLNTVEEALITHYVNCRWTHMTDWIAFENGTTVGATGSEGGTILWDDLHPDGARITLERTASRFAITCGVYGWWCTRGSLQARARRWRRTRR